MHLQVATKFPRKSTAPCLNIYFKQALLLYYQPMKATVILLTYNQESSVERALKSLLAQECTYPYEILVADDSSSDNTRQICLKLAKSNPNIIRMMPVLPNRGLVGNYFDAFEEARGEYISDCAGDDEWLDPKRLQKSIELLDSDPSLSAVFTNVEIRKTVTEEQLKNTDIKRQNKIRNSTNHIKNTDTISHTSDNPEYARWMRPRIPGREILKGLFNHRKTLPYILSSALYRKESVMKIYSKDKEMIRNPEGGVEDVPLIAALASQGDAAYIPIDGYRYYLEEESVSNSKSPAKLYRFYSRVLTLIGTLSLYYGIPLQNNSDYFKRLTLYLASLARLAREPELASDLKRRASAWPQRLPMKARLHLLLLKVIKR